MCYCFVMFCVFLYGPFCHGAHKLDLSTLFTTFFLWTSPPFILWLLPRCLWLKSRSLLLKIEIQFPHNNFSLLWPIDTKLSADVTKIMASFFLHCHLSFLINVISILGWNVENLVSSHCGVSCLMLKLFRCPLITDNEHLLRDPELSNLTRNCQICIKPLDTLKIGINTFKNFTNCIKVKRIYLFNSIYSSFSPVFCFKETHYGNFFTDPELSCSL